MNTSGLENIIGQALKNLSAAWRETNENWRDAKAAEFEATYLEPLPHHVVRVLTVVTEVNALLKKIKEDCE